MKFYGGGSITLDPKKIQEVLTKLAEKDLIPEGSTLQESFECYFPCHMSMADNMVVIDIQADGETNYDSDTPRFLGCFAGLGEGSVAFEDEDGLHFRISIDPNQPEGYLWEDGTITFGSDYEHQTLEIETLREKLKAQALSLKADTQVHCSGVWLDNEGTVLLRLCYGEFDAGGNLIDVLHHIPRITEADKDRSWRFIFQLYDTKTEENLAGAKSYYDLPEAALMDFTYIWKNP